MKTIKYIFLSLIIVASSCSLEEDPYGVYSNQNFYSTEEDALSALLYAYEPINYIEYAARFMLYMGDVSSNQYKMYGKAQETNLYTWEVDTNTDEFLYLFKYCYLSIGRANSVLENVAGMSNISASSKNQYLGEAYFLRAFNYFMLVKNYGSVPYRSKSVTGTSEIQAPYATIEELYGYIIKDLETATSLMEIVKSQGRADKVAAQALLSKVYLTMASSKMTGAPGYDWVKDYEEAYQQASKWAQEVLNKQSSYALEEDLTKVYDVDYHATSPEHIFITSMNREGVGFEGVFSQLPQMFGIGLAPIYISKNLDGSGGVQKFLNTEGNCWSVFRVDEDFYNQYSDQDLRKALMVSTIYKEDGSVLATYSDKNLTDSDPVKNAFYYPFCRKYTDYQSNSHRTSANIYLIRFAEVALTCAEAEGPTAEGYKWVNAVRNRAQLDPLPTGMSKEEFRKAIWDEREFELAFEGHGIYELRRTNRVKEKVTNKNVKDEFAYFYPVPQRELDLNQ